MRRIKKLAALVLAVAMVLSLTACGTIGEDSAWAYELDGEQMPAGVYIHYLISAYRRAQTLYMEQEERDVDQEVTLPTLKDLKGFEIDGVAGDVWIAQKAQDYAMQYYGAEILAEEMGIALSDIDVENVLGTAEAVFSGQIDSMYLWYYGLEEASFYEQNGIAQSSFETYSLNQTLKADLFEALYGEGGTEAPTEQEMMDAFVSTYAAGDVITIYKEYTSETNGKTDEEVDAVNAELLAEAQGYLNRLSAGEDIRLIEYERRLLEAGLDISGGVSLPEPADEAAADDSSEEEADAVDPEVEDEEDADADDGDAADADADADSGDETEADADAADGAEGDAADDTAAEDDTADGEEEDEFAASGVTAPEENELQRVIALDQVGSSVMNQAIVDAAPGQALLVEDDYAIYLVVGRDLTGDEETLETYRSALLNEMKNDAFEELLAEKGKAAGVVENPKAISRYTASSIKES